MDIKSTAEYLCHISNLAPSHVHTRYGGWISPEGDVFQTTRRVSTHSDLADYLIDYLGLDRHRYGGHHTLYYAGWVRWVTCGGDICLDGRETTAGEIPLAMAVALRGLEGPNLEGVGVSVELDAGVGYSRRDIERAHPKFRQRVNSFLASAQASNSASLVAA